MYSIPLVYSFFLFVLQNKRKSSHDDDEDELGDLVTLDTIGFEDDVVSMASLVDIAYIVVSHIPILTCDFGALKKKMYM